MTCTFFGNRDINTEIVKKPLNEILTYLIENKGVDTFYVGNQGNFDYLVRTQLEILKEKYPYISYGIALAYIPKEKKENERMNYEQSFIPEGVEKGPIRFAIDRRNRWLIKNSDYVITCVRGNIGGAAKYKEIAEKKGKIVINIRKGDGF